MKSKVLVAIVAAVITSFAFVAIASAYYYVPIGRATQRAKEYSRYVCEEEGCGYYSWGCVRSGRSAAKCKVDQEYAATSGGRETCWTYLRYGVGFGGGITRKVGESFCAPGSIEEVG